MTEIQELLLIETKIEKGKLCFYITAKDIEITELRIVKAFSLIENAVKQLYRDDIKKVYFVYNINELNLPSNFTQIGDLATILKNHETILAEKLVFSIVQNKNNVFSLFFKLFREYYNPVKALYLCKDSEETRRCLHNSKSRDSFPNICNLLL
tara:strand:- start:468 stop:926 length:459 start_codon:yes stop_codon:yes gene_type:complete